MLLLVGGELGSFRGALRQLGITPACAVIVSEKAESRRVLKRSWPDSGVLTGMNDFTTEKALKLRRQHVRL